MSNQWQIVWFQDDFLVMSGGCVIPPTLSEDSIDPTRYSVVLFSWCYLVDLERGRSTDPNFTVTLMTCLAARRSDRVH